MLTIDNAIRWAHFRLRGGWRSMGLMCGGYLAIALLIVIMSNEMATVPRQRTDAMMEITYIMFAIQAVLLLIFGSLRVGGAVRRDVASKQIESHRLMPIRPMEAVLGYLAGATPGVLALAILNFAMGIFTSAMGGISPNTWTICNAALLGFAITLWCMMMVTAFISPVVFWISNVVMVVFGLAQGFRILPGLIVLCGPLQGDTIFDLKTTAAKNLTGLVMSQVFQWILAGLLLIAAARKYARPDALAFSVPASMAKLFLWVAMSFYGMWFYDALAGSLGTYGSEDFGITMFVGSIAATMLVSLFVLASLAWTAIARDERVRVLGLSGRRKHSLFLPCMLLCVCAISALTYARPHVRSWQYNWTPAMQQASTQPGANPAPVWTSTFSADAVVTSFSERAIIALVSAIFLTQVYLMMAMLYPWTKKANWVLLFVCAFLWLGPIIFDGLTNLMIQPTGQSVKLTYGLGSPLGMIIGVANRYDATSIEFVAGFVYQVVLLAVIWMIYVLTSRKKAAPEPVLAALG